MYCERLTTLTSRERQQLREIYERSFPAEERKPFDQIASGVAQGIYTCLVAKTSDDPNDIAAFALTLLLPDTAVAFLEYIAVALERQAQGIGSLLFDALIRELTRCGDASQIVWEVEPPDSIDPQNHKNRRIRFYERLGGKLITLSTPYRMPDYEQRSEGVPLLLMLAPMEAQPNKSAVSAIIKGIYAVAYRHHITLRDQILQDLALLPDLP